MDGQLTIKRDSRARRAKPVYHNLSVPYDSGKLDRASISRTLGAAATGEVWGSSRCQGPKRPVNERHVRGAGYSVLAVNNLVPVPLKARDANRFGDGLAVVLPHEPDPEPAGAGGRRAAIQGPKRALQPLVSPFRPEQAAGTGVRPPRQLSRITLTCDGDRDGGAARLAEALNRPEPGTYDLVAACPASEAALAACLATGRVDIISIDCAARPDLALRP
ncbi:unnamed protein product, partial [Symbiodinium sp. KB8]